MPTGGGHREFSPDQVLRWERLWLGVRPEIVRRRLDPGGVAGVGPCDHFTLWLLISGRGRLELQGRHLSVRADMGVLTPAGLTTQLFAADRAMEYILVPFDLSLGGQRLRRAAAVTDLQRMVLRLPGVPEVSLHGGMMALNFGQIMLRTRHLAHAELGELEGQIQLLRVFYQLRQALLRPDRDYPRLESKPPVRRAYVYLLEHAADPNLSLGELARHVGLSVPSLVRSFRQQYSQSPMRVLARERLVQARRLLSQPEFKVAEVAAACGFSSSAYFCRVFAAELGMTPTQFRRQQPSGDASGSPLL